ncbi:hypothetical protein DFQ01_10165 [Paenibacillus cellulosilyticus]|uniref:N-acetyltransferase domain-containing protein n=1 Tax=Paenibacillus cellulosilyticus TaxID=375489 RepID=A0A2V2YZW6_9BACL|nr:UDP-4-amino-4,6-dideoxy-N-acetyl-beta-L-altrosamine N-acetyltransferase [Paenibacillus cellulosilyticus]PWW08344.1 hypothetical protein DFQ01_10165 [Paenibacillus cellulosilyticus]QKS47942.1 UDP-4-amino-4,6-dideoxy-N-acetyl-beta-L-altrosamine N-acetyltransferase [Paenibacillus cellulosilyticus]
MIIGDYRMRPLSEHDLKMVLDWRNAEHVRSKMFTDTIITWEEHEAWFKRIAKLDHPAHFIFEYKGRPIGYINYVDLNARDATGSSGLYLGEQDNLPVEAGLALEYFTIEYAFEKVGLRKLWGYVLAFNKRVIKLHGMFGYTKEGLLKEHVFKNGKYEDLVIMSLFYEDWKLKRDRLREFFYTA